MIENSQIGFIGGGNMGEALIKGMIGASLLKARQIHAFDVLESRARYLAQNYGITPCRSIPELARACDTVILAVKPQNMAEVLSELRSHVAHSPLIISIAAGIALSSICDALPEGIPAVRVMPNTPALVLQGASALSRGPHVTDDSMRKALTLFGAVGTAIEVEEKSMDAVTGLSGSGPGYFLLILESMIDAGVLMGIPRPVARELVVQTALGTAKMVQETGKHPGELKDLITSPGGTTIRGLAIMEENGVRGTLMRAVEAATLRSRELAGK